MSTHETSLFDVIDRMTQEAHSSQLNIARSSPPIFDGETFDPEQDTVRLTGQLARVYTVMSDGLWRTLSELKNLAGGSEAGVSARLRDLRKRKWGAQTVNRRRRSEGLWEYQLKVQ